MLRRAVIAALSLVALLGGVIATAAPSHAANLGTVTVSYSNFTYSVAPSSLAGSIGDTFALANTLTSGNSDPVYYVSLMNDTGSVSLGGTSCSQSTDCQVLDLFAGTATGTFTVTGEGVVKVMRFYQSSPATQIGTITITSGSSSSTTTDPALVYPTAYLNPNGGTCTGTLQFTKYNGQNGTITLPTAGACTRDGYLLFAWTPANIGGFDIWPPGTTLPIGDESFTVNAVWSPSGVEVVYDAGVAKADACVTNGSNTIDRISIPRNYSPSDTLATTAPCTPANMVLAGWKNSITGAVYSPGDAVTKLGADQGDRVTLIAQWKVTYGLELSTTTTTLNPGGSTTVTVKATLNGSPAANATVSLSVPEDAPVSLPGGGTSTTVVTNASGEAIVAVTARDGKAGEATLTAAYGDKTATIRLLVSAPPAERSIVITGERGSVGGKPGVSIDGTTTGFKEGDTVIVMLRFPGQTTYTRFAANLAVDASGNFTWQRKTGKKIYIYVTSQDASVKSNRIILQAN